MAVVGAFDHAGVLVTHAELNGRSVMSNGFQMLKYNPITGNLVPAVLRPFRGTFTAAAGAAGVLLGDYVYRVVPYNENEDEEGEINDEDIEFTAANQQIVINRAAVNRDDPETTHWRIYRGISGGVYPVLALVATVPWATLTYTDNTPDDDLDFLNEGVDLFTQWPTPKPFLWIKGSRMFGIGDIPYDQGTIQVTNGSALVVPNAPAVFGFWAIGKELHIEGDGRAYVIEEFNPATGVLTLRDDYAGANDATANYRICGDPDAGIFTEEGFETQWAAANIVHVSKKDGDKPTGGMGVPGGCIVTKSRKTYIWKFDNFPNIPYGRVDILSNQYGGISHRTMRMVNDVPTWATKAGIVQVGGGGVRHVSFKSNEWVEDNLELESNGTQQMCFSVNWTSKQLYILFIKSNASVIGCDKALVWHYGQNKFTTWEFDTEFTCGELIKTDDGADEIHVGCVNGYVWKLGFGDADGPPSNTTVSGTVDLYFAAGSPDICIIEDADAQFPTTGLGLAGVPIYIHTGTGAGQKAIIVDNTATTLQVECFDVELDETSEYYIGRIVAQYKSGWLDFGTIDRIKDFKYYNIVNDKEDDSTLIVRFYKDFEAVPVDIRDQSVRIGIDEDTGEVNGSIDIDELNRQRVAMGGIRAHHISFELYDDKPNNPFTVLDISFDYRFGDN